MWSGEEERKVEKRGAVGRNSKIQLPAVIKRQSCLTVEKMRKAGGSSWIRQQTLGGDGGRSFLINLQLFTARPCDFKRAYIWLYIYTQT